VNINQVKSGMSAKVTSDSISGKTMTATLTSVDPLATETQGVVSYTAYFTPDKEASQLLKPGMTVQLSLVVAQAKDVLLVPRSALQTSGNRYLVMVWDGTKFTAQPVGVGILNDQMAEIKSGLNEGDQVAISLEGSVTQSTLGRQGGYFMPGEGIGIPAGEPPSGSRRSP
jgi:macrolide-specific efflux system membrane fusion protein